MRRKSKIKQQNTVIIESGGVGTTIANVLEKTGVKALVEIFIDGKDCGCAEREAKINELLPYRFKARCLTEQEYRTYKEFVKTRTLKMSAQQVTYICELYASVFNRQVWKPECAGCNAKTIIGMIDKLDKVFESYEN